MASRKETGERHPLEHDDYADNPQFSVQEQSSTKPVPTEKSDEHFNHDPSLQTRQSPQKVKVRFNLYVQGHNVDEAQVIFSHHKEPVALTLGGRMGDSNLWQTTFDFDIDPKQVSYHYRIFTKGNKLSDVPFLGKLFSKEPIDETESSIRHISSQAQFDTFHSNSDLNYAYDTLPKSSIFYMQWLIDLVSHDTIKSILMQIEAMYFRCHPVLVSESVKYILERVADPSCTDFQRLYLSVVLGHLSKNNPQCVLFASDFTTKSNVDRLLQAFHSCAKLQLLPSSSLKILEEIAPRLVSASSNPNWLTLAAHFCSYLGAPFAVENMVLQKCDAKEYRRLVSYLLPFLARESDDETQKLHLRLLVGVLKVAPNQEAVRGLYESPDLGDYFTQSGLQKDDFFIEYYQNLSASTHQLSGKSVSQGEKLLDLMKMPTKLRTCNKMTGTVRKTLLDFLNQTKGPKKEHLEAFGKLIVCLPSEFVKEVLAALCSSKLPPVHNLLLTIIDDTNFEANWWNLTLVEKVEICFEWIVSKLHTKQVDGKNNMQLTADVYECVNELMAHANIGYNQTFVERVCERVEEKILGELDPITILKSYIRIESYDEVIQDCYIAFVKYTLGGRPRILRKAITQLNNVAKLNRCQRKLAISSHSKVPVSTGPIFSRLGLELLLCTLELMKIPASGGNDEEDDYKEMLDWSDVWTILLSAKGDEKIRKNSNFHAGRKKWQAFAARIKDGKVSARLLDDITKHEEDLSSICATVNLGFVNQSEFLKVKEMYQESISKLLKVRKECDKKLELLRSLITCGKNVSEDTCTVDGINDLVQEMNKREKCWRTQKLSQLKDEAFWGPLKPLLGPAKLLKPLMKSVSFMNVAKICLQESQGPPTLDEPKARDIYWLATFLATKATHQFLTKWHSIFYYPGSLTTETMKPLLGTLKIQQLEVELSLVQAYFPTVSTSHVKDYISGYVNFPNVLKQAKRIITLLDTFGLLNSTESISYTLTSFVSSYEDSYDLSLNTLKKSMLAVDDIVSSFVGEEAESIVEELGKSKELVSFLREIVDEDIRFLIDAVEEYSDQHVSESLVSDLIDVHGFLAPLIRIGKQSGNAQQFFAALKKSCAVNKEGMAVKLNQCSTNVNSLKGLYTSVANRGEITKEIIANGLKKGVYSVALKDDGLPEVQMSYQRDNSLAATYALSELHDLRSRAHLIANSEKSASKVLFEEENENEEIDFSDFIVQVNLLTEIINLLSKLQSSGYVKYRKFWKQMRGTKTLQDTKDELQHDLETWEGILSSAREQYYFLNYYRSDHLCILHDFLTNCSQVSCEDVLSLIHFVDPTIKKEQLEEYRKPSPTSKRGNSSDNPTAMVSIIGNALDEILADTSPVIRLIRSNQEQSPFHSSTFDANVKPGELFLASLEAKSQLTANVLLTLYETTSNAFPEPYQVVFCSTQTTWEEIFLLLQRCFAQSQHLKHDSLFCIANVELLTNEVQFRLVNAIKEKQNISRGPGSLKENANYRLALICCGGDHHHIAEQFAQYSHHVAGMSDSALSERLKSGWPEVRMITSTLPGLGKTERIKSEVVDKDMNVVTFSISGPLDQSKLVRRLRKLDLKKYHCLHLDIGEVDDPLWLDTFLFQLIVTGMVSSGTQLYHLLTAHVYIEIANTLNDWLRQSLVISKSFTRVHLKWQNYEDLLVSSEITSNVQVVCQYFDVFDRARLESDDIHFTGPKKVQPLPATRCRELLANHYSSEEDTTFSALNIFLAVLADQLVKLSNSAFFKIATLKSMLGDDGAHGVRTNLFQALLEVSKEFASRAITSCRSSEISALSEKEAAEALDKAVLSSGMSAQHMVERVEGMIQWEDSNHLLVVFHAANSQAIAAVYRDKTLVPPNVEKLLKSQVVKGKKKELEDFKLMSQEELQEKLEKIACTKPVKQSGGNLYPSYALTPDNILKMILIILRVRANAPVIIMGETGCGKTSLVRYLANTCQIEFCTFNFHAGITEEEIIEFIGKEDRQARESGEQIWVFLDEINTCDHLGLISDVMCHHTLLGQPLSKNLVFLAACNPYKLRPKEHIKTAGLEGKNVTDEYSGLVYRVHPLPEAMIDYVWDYGSLSPNDEKTYIQRMVRTLSKKYQGMLVDLLAESQKFIREAEKNPFCVSLRDVYRCILLIQWFMNMIKKRGKMKRRNDYPDPKHLRKYRLIWERYDKKPDVKSIVLALAHCYLSRLPTAELRNSYQTRMTTLFSGNGTMMKSSKDGVNAFSAIVRMEEEDYLNRMELPPGTAKNAALRENVFVMLVCILNRIPVFVVGMPGCSKSLSIQLIRSNLRGRDSNDPLFRQLPQLYVVSYQGSESSTSDGIIKVFEKARKYKSHNKDGNVLPVVLLDEVGLAENSKYNPLKVLHSLLEPGDGQLPDVAVVGISNWSLDAAKMNRAIHLSRPEPTKHDLYETGYFLHYADSEGTGQYNQHLSSQELQCLADAYSEYQPKQKHANFHGLRDYYSLIKSLSRSSDVLQVNMALQRNFGGIPGELDKIQKIFLDKLEECTLSSGEDIIPVAELIKGNLTDAWARHLMLITSGDSAIGILKQNLSKLEKEIITIFGSRFEEDLSEEYNYRILSRIILCMERDCVLILRDLESIYGSLYDMLNQNYSLVGKRKNCRIALGAYSNPMCHVNDGFRCIVLTDHHKVDFTDPPFLNRFEKQLLRFSDVLDRKQQEVIAELHHWVQQLSTIQGLESHFKESDMFIGFHEDTLPSLVLSHSHDPEESADEIISKCKDDLMWVASPDGVLRAEKSDGFKEDSQEVKKLSNEYFKKPIHQGLASFMETVTGDQECSKTNDEIGSKTIVMTFSNIHTDIQKCMSDTAIKCQTERLSAYKSEKQLAERINHFWTTPDQDLLVLQCKPELDNTHMLLARSIIEEKRSSYRQDCQDVEVKRRKHVCIVVHIQRGTLSNSVPWQFSFLCGWKQVFLDVLEASPVSLDAIRTESIHTLLTSSIWPIRRIAQNDLPWCFTRIKYTRQQRPLDSILRIAQNLFRSEKVCKAIEHLVLQWVKMHGDKRDEDAVFNEGWQVKVACDKQALINSSTLYCAMEQFVSRLVREPLAKIIYFLEKENAWPPHVFDRSEENALVSDFEDMWCGLILKKGIFDMSEIPEPLGAESYVLDSISLDLHLPFSQVVIKIIDATKDLFLEDYAQVLENEDNLDEAQTENAQQQQLMRYSEIVTNLVPEIQEFPASCRDFYMADLFDLTTADFSAKLSRHQRLSTVKAAFVSTIKRSLQVKDTLHFFVQLHTFVWIHKEQIVDQLRMVDCCRSFVNPDVLTIVTKDFLSSQNELTYTNSDDEERHVKITDGDSEDESKEFLEPKPRDDEPTELHSGNEDEGPENESNALQEQKLPAEDDHSQSKGGYDSEDESKEFREPKLRDDKPIELYSENPENEINNALQEPKLPAEDDRAQSKGEYDSGDDATDSQKTEQQDYADQTNDTIFDDIEREDQEMAAEWSETDVEEETNKSCEDEKLGVEQESFEDILVKVYCEEMLPSPETVEKCNGGLESWIRNACLLLSLALKISDQTPAFHFLRLCVDFAKIVLASSDSQKLPLYPLYIINEIGNNLNPWYLDAENSFQEITEQLIRPLEDQVKDDAVKHEALQKFSALFYVRCIDTNVDTRGARQIVEDVLSLDRADLVLMMGPVILCLLRVEEMEKPGVFVKLITNPSVIEQCPCLQNIDEVFKDLSSDGSIHHDSYAAVMICDLIQSLSFDDRYSIEDINGSDCELLRCVNTAVAVLSESEQDSCGLVLLSAVAFLRAFLTMFSRFIVEKANILKADSQYSHVLTEVNSLLTAGEERRLSLQFFFLKQLHQNMSFFDLRKLCRESEILHAIKGIWDDDKSVDKAEFVSVCKLPEYQKVKAAYWKLISEDETYMLAFLDQCQNSSNHCLALLGILVNMIYLKRTVQKLTDKEEQIVEWFLQKVKLFPLPLKELLLRIMGRKDFHCPQLQLSPESTVDEIETALLILHITCVVASGVQGGISPVYQYFSNPRKSKQSGYILAHGKERMYHLFDKRESVSGPSSFTCTCGLRLMFKNEHEDNRCPHCNSRVHPKTEKTPPSSSKSSSPLPVKEPECQWDVATNGTNPSVYRALHLIVYASFYAGVAVKVSSKEDLSSLLNYLENDLHVTSTTNTECQDPAKFCFDQVANDLSCLMTILSCKKDVAIKVMNLVVEKCTALIRDNTLDKNTCSTRKQLLEWEEEFSNLTKDVLPKALGSTKVLKEVMRMQQTEENRESYILKYQIQELDEYPSEPKKQNLHLKRLFRVTRQPTFEEFRAIFVNSSKHFQRKHSFLSLLFARFHELPNLVNLYHLLKWSRVVSSALTHRISRKEAQSKSCTIDDFISGHLLGQDRSKEERKSYKKLFDDFKKAWDEMRHLVNQQLTTGNKMTRLCETDNIAYCLTESDSGGYLLTAIRILVLLQNSILDETLLLSTLHKHPALSFLAKDNNCSGIPSVTLQEAKEKEIINFEWSDELFAMYAQNNPEYGYGEEVSYDFEGMELKLASRLAFGKCYLTGSLNRFIFSKELFHSCGPLLTEVRELLTQSPILPDDVRQGLSRLKERRIKAQDLLQHIEVLIFVLKLKLKNFDEEITLETFAEEWLSMLPSPFPVSLLPQPSSSIKLKHIAALYEALEDILADAAIDGLLDQFRQELSSEMKSELDDLVDKDSPLELHALLNALRRFVFRYLSAEKFLPTGNPTLRSSLKEPSLWSPATPPDLQIIPNEMTLEHVHSIITYLQDIEKERKGNARRQNEKRPQRWTPPVVVSSTQGGRSRRRVKCKD